MIESQQYNERRKTALFIFLCGIFLTNAILAEIVGVSPVVLNQMVAGLAAVLVIAVELYEPGQTRGVGIGAT